MDNKKIIDTIKEQGVVPLFYNSDKEVSANIIKALYDNGIRLIEWTNRGADAVDNFIYLKKIVADKMPGLYLGAGTIKTLEQAKAYIDAGADFIISPALTTGIAALVHSHNLLWIPGCMTPTEIFEAEQAGTPIVKIFPANVLGPAFIRSVKEVFPQMMFMPTGGFDTDKEKLQPWFDAGVIAVGMGSTLISRKIIEEKDFATLGQNAKRLLSDIKEIRK